MCARNLEGGVQKGSLEMPAPTAWSCCQFLEPFCAFPVWHPAHCLHESYSLPGALVLPNIYVGSLQLDSNCQILKSLVIKRLSYLFRLKFPNTYPQYAQQIGHYVNVKIIHTNHNNHLPMGRIGRKLITVNQLFSIEKVKFSIIHKGQLLSYVLGLGPNCNTIWLCFWSRF